ncbi:cupin domain-containing protein [Streptomyces avermitilis]
MGSGGRRPAIRRGVRPGPRRPTGRRVGPASGDVLYLPRGWWHSVTAPEGEHTCHKIRTSPDQDQPQEATLGLRG